MAGIDLYILTKFVGCLFGKDVGRFEGAREGSRVGRCVGYKYKQNGGKTKSESVWRVNILHWLALINILLPKFVGCLVGKDVGRFEGARKGSRVGSCVGYNCKQNGGKMKSESVWRVNILHWLA